MSMVNSSVFYPRQNSFDAIATEGIIPSNITSNFSTAILNSYTGLFSGKTFMTGAYNSSLGAFPISTSSSGYKYAIYQVPENTMIPRFYNYRIDIALTQYLYQYPDNNLRIIGFMLPSAVLPSAATVAQLSWLSTWALPPNGEGTIPNSYEHTYHTSVSSATTVTDLAGIPKYPRARFDFNHFTGTTGTSGYGYYFYFVVFATGNYNTYLQVNECNFGYRGEVDLASMFTNYDYGKSFNRVQSSYSLNATTSVLLRKGYNRQLTLNPTDAYNQGKAAAKLYQYADLPISLNVAAMNGGANSAILSNIHGARALYLISAKGATHAKSYTSGITAAFTGANNTFGYAYFPNAGGQISMTVSTCRFLYVGNVKSNANVYFAYNNPTAQITFPNSVAKTTNTTTKVSVLSTFGTNAKNRIGFWY